MPIKKDLYPLLTVNILAVLAFSLYFISKANYEFILYIAVIMFFLLLIGYSTKYVDYPKPVLWGLTIWSIMHMSGGGIPVGEGVLYGLILLPISETYEILKYDQLVHAFGFGIATLVVWTIIKPHLTSSLSSSFALSLTVVMAGLGLGALNEIVEFIATVITPETGVGGYVNTSLDLIANLFGAMLALVYIRYAEKKQTRSASV